MSTQLKTHGRRFLAVALSILMMLPFMSGFAAFVPQAKAADDVSVWDGTIPGQAPDGFTQNGDTYTISTALGFVWFFKTINNGTTYAGKTVYLSTDVDLNCENGSHNTKWSDVYYDETKTFEGTFNGNSHTISGLNTNDTVPSTSEYFGLFRKVAGTVKIMNLEFCDCIIQSSSANMAILIGLTDMHSNVTITNVSIYDCSVTGAYSAGGFVAENRSASLSFNRCDNYCDVTAESASAFCAGGYVGYSSQITDEKATLEFVDCMMDESTVLVDTMDQSGAAGGYVGFTEVLNESSAAGNGIMGYLTFRRCENKAEVRCPGDNKMAAGGFVGTMPDWVTPQDVKNTRILFKQCDNYGSVSAGGEVGGFAGHIGTYAHCFAFTCFNYGDILQSTTGMASISDVDLDAGGMIGCTLSSLYLDQCVNFGRVSGDECTGGLVGKSYFIEVKRCANTGTITYPEEHVSYMHGTKGGLVGYIDYRNDYCTSDSLITDSFNWGDVCNRRKEHHSGILGYIAPQRNCTIQNVYNHGSIVSAFTDPEEEYDGYQVVDPTLTNVAWSNIYNTGLGWGFYDNSTEMNGTEPEVISATFCKNPYNMSGMFPEVSNCDGLPIHKWYRDNFLDYDNDGLVDWNDGTPTGYVNGRMEISVLPGKKAG